MVFTPTLWSTGWEIEIERTGTPLISGMVGNFVEVLPPHS